MSIQSSHKAPTFEHDHIDFVQFTRTCHNYNVCRSRLRARAWALFTVLHGFRTCVLDARRNHGLTEVGRLRVYNRNRLCYLDERLSTTLMYAFVTNFKRFEDMTPTEKAFFLS